MKISKELTVSILIFNGGTGEQYVKLLEDFKSIMHKKVLCTIYKKVDANQNACQAEFEMYLLGNPKPK